MLELQSELLNSKAPKRANFTYPTAESIKTQRQPVDYGKCIVGRRRQHARD